MIIDTVLTIAYKCSSCGTYEFYNVSLFKFLQRKEYFMTCRCKKTGMVIREILPFRYNIAMLCIACGSEHFFNVSIKEMIGRNLNVFCCPHTGIQLCFIGNDMHVRERVDALEKELDEMMDNFGYDNYFKNTRVMFDSLNRIHDIAEQGNLICECGSSDVELVLLSDKIELKCNRCPRSTVIHAASNEDLKYTLRTQQIFLRELQHTI